MNTVTMEKQTETAPPRQERAGEFQIPSIKDPRWPFFAILIIYSVLGVTTLGFNRSPVQLFIHCGAGRRAGYGLSRSLTRGITLSPFGRHQRNLSGNSDELRPWRLVSGGAGIFYGEFKISHHF